MAMILISSLPPATTDGLVKDLEALGACASTGPGSSNPDTPKETLNKGLSMGYR